MSLDMHQVYSGSESVLLEILETGLCMKGRKESTLEQEVHFRWFLAERHHHGCQ